MARVAAGLLAFVVFELVQAWHGHATVGYPATSCRTELRIFSSLRDGDFDFCRLKLAYVPGKADCLRAVTTICTSFVFDGSSFVPQNIVDSRTERIFCPPGPVPPSCPSDLPNPVR